MWDSSSHFAAQTSAWCGSTTVSGSGFLSNIRARQSDPGLRRWQSMYNLAHESPTRRSPELRASRGGSRFYQTEVEQWLQDAHEHLSTELDRLRPRDMTLNNTLRTRVPDVKQKQVLKPNWDLGRDEPELSLFNRSTERRELQEKVQKLESDLLQIRSTLDKRSNDSLNRTPSNTQEDFIKETVDTELRETQREAEARAKTNEEESKKTLEELHTSEENQRMMQDQIEEMNKRLKENSEVQEELREANNKLSQADLDKAVLSTQVLKLEDEVKDIKTKLTEAQSANNHLIQEKDDLLLSIQNLEVQLRQNSQKTDPSSDSESQNKQETELMKEDLKTLKQINEKLRREAEVMKKSVDSSRCQLQELQEEGITTSKHIAELQAQRSQLIRENKDLLSQINQQEVLIETKEKYRTSADVLALEAQKLRDQCASLEVQVQQKEEMLQLQDEEHRIQDEMRARCIEELKAVTSHWTKKWQNVALSLQSTQNQLEDLKKSSISKMESDSELEQRRTQTFKVEGGEPVQTVDKQTLTDLSESSLIHSSESESPQNKSPQLQEWLESSEIQRLRQILAEKEKEANERELTLSRLERLREMEKTAAQIKISALELQLLKKVPESCDDGGLLEDASDSLSIDDSRRTGDQLQQQETIQEHQTLRQHSSQDKDNKISVEGKKDNLICPVNPEMELQRRMLTEQLKSLFKEREDKNSPASPEDWTPPALFVRAGGDRRSWQQNSGLMPVFEEDEEDEEDSDSPGEEEEDATEDSQAEP